MDIVSNHGNYMYWSDPSQRIHTSGARMDADMRVLLKEFQARAEAGEPMPEHLLIVEDSAPDNKNKYRQTFYALLVKEGIFHSVQMLYLLVGHTHWKVDQIFSVLSRAVKSMNRGLMTFEDLRNLLEKVYTDYLGGRENIVEEVRDVPALKEWIESVCFLFTAANFMDFVVRFDRNGKYLSQNDVEHGIDSKSSRKWEKW